MAVEDIYRQGVLAHNRAPRRFGELPGATHAGDGDNPACGDALHVALRVNAGRIEDLRFRGEACAVTVAAASMLGDLIVDAGTARLQELREKFARLLGGGPGDPDLGELAALAELSRHPTRHRCALLPFEAVQSALASPPVDAAAPGARTAENAAGGER
jgi:nitrogen fixation NifU-like protein